jgi:hypothetical protein
VLEHLAWVAACGIANRPSDAIGNERLGEVLVVCDVGEPATEELTSLPRLH